MKNTIILVITFALLSIFGVSGKNADAKTEHDLIDTTKIISFKLKYPAEAKRKGMEGTVEVKITFDAECNIIKKEIVKSLGYGCDEEALNALTNMESKIKKAKGQKCQQGEELIYPVNFKIN